MAPAVYHRIRWQQGNKTDVIRVAHRMFLTGMASLAIAMTTAVWFVSAFLFGTVESLVAASLSVVLLGLTWFALPLGVARGGRVRMRLRRTETGCGRETLSPVRGARAPVARA